MQNVFFQPSNHQVLTKYKVEFISARITSKVHAESTLLGATVPIAEFFERCEYIGPQNTQKVVDFHRSGEHWSS